MKLKYERLGDGDHVDETATMIDSHVAKGGIAYDVFELIKKHKLKSVTTESGLRLRWTALPETRTVYEVRMVLNGHFFGDWIEVTQLEYDMATRVSGVGYRTREVAS